MLGLIGKKVGMTQIFSENGNMIPVTVILAGPCTVIQKKTDEKDGYTALQIGFDNKKTKRTTKPLQEHFKKANTSPKKVLSEFRVNQETLKKYEPGQTINADNIFAANDFIDISGKSKGRGFTGVMKRHNFKGAKASHGVRDFHRHGGSIGMSSTPARVPAGTKMAGQYGNQKTTLQNLKIVKVDKENNLLLIKGAVPGANGGYVIINKAVKRKQKADKK